MPRSTTAEPALPSISTFIVPLAATNMHTHIHTPPSFTVAGVELGVNYPWPIITPEAARQGIALASAVVQRCALGGSAAGSGSGASSGTDYSGSGDGPAGSGGSGSAAAAGGGGAQPLVRKEPYRPPTDPSLMSSFLAAAAARSGVVEGAGWQDALPPLHIHSANGHPLSLTHSAQQRPLWVPSSLRRSAGRGQGLPAAVGLALKAGLLDAKGCYLGLHRGHMGQQQLLAGPAAAAAGVRAARVRRRSGDGDADDGSGGCWLLAGAKISPDGSSGSASPRRSGAGSVSVTTDSMSCGAAVEAASASVCCSSGAAAGAENDNDIADSSGGGGGVGCWHADRAQASPNAAASSESSGQVVPSARGAEARPPPRKHARHEPISPAVGGDDDGDVEAMMLDAAGVHGSTGTGSWRRFGAAAVVGGAGDIGGARRGVSLATACSHVCSPAGPAAAAAGTLHAPGAAAPGHTCDEEQQDNGALATQAARLHSLSIAQGSRHTG